MVITARQRSIRRAIQYALMTCCGVLLGCVAIFTIFAIQEDALLTDMVEKATMPQWTEEQKGVALTDLTYRLLQPRQKFFRGEGRQTWRTTWFRSVDMELVEARGSCGSFTHVVARLLDSADIQHRIFQMYCEKSKNFGCHIALEAKIDGVWRSVDALYNVVAPVSALELG